MMWTLDKKIMESSPSLGFFVSSSKVPNEVFYLFIFGYREKLSLELLK